jgi:hypothetical protein
MTTFHIPNAINPKSWTCGEVIEENVRDFNELKFVVAMIANHVDSDTQKVIVQMFAPHMEVRK